MPMDLIPMNEAAACMTMTVISVIAVLPSTWPKQAVELHTVMVLSVIAR